MRQCSRHQIAGKPIFRSNRGNRYKKSPDRLAKACKDVTTGAFADASLGVIIILAESHSLHNL